jgi:hypothetical protein
MDRGQVPKDVEKQPRKERRPCQNKGSGFAAENAQRLPTFHRTDSNPVFGFPSGELNGSRQIAIPPTPGIQVKSLETKPADKGKNEILPQRTLV